MLTNGKKLDGRYIIHREIGSGGFGAVFLATDTRFTGNNQVAIKQITLNNEQAAKAFHHEANLLYNLTHPNLPKVTNCFQEDGSNYIVMDYISGEDLAQSLMRGKRFPVAEVLQIADAVLDALEYLHLNSIIHRDIKPHNIKVDATGRIFLLDFGTAKGNLDVITQTFASGQSITGYTPFYAPLEQVLRVDANSYLLLQSLNSQYVEEFAEKRTDVRSDIYSSGATLYHLLTNYSPEKATATIRAHALWSGKNDPLPPMQALNPEIPPGLANIVHRALELQPERRFQTAHEFRNALKNVGTGENHYPETDDFLSVPTATLVIEQKREAQPPPLNEDQSIPTQVGHLRENLLRFVIEQPEKAVEPLPEKVVEQPEKIEPKPSSLKYAIIASLIFSLLVLCGLGALLVWENSTDKPVAAGNLNVSPSPAKKEPARSLNYSLSVQKMRDGKEYQEPFESSGREVFESGYKFQMRLTPPDDGYLYIFAEGLDDRQEKIFKIIFPTPLRNDGLSGVSPVQRYETGWNVFDGKTGTENFWIIWDKILPETAEKARENAFENEGVVTDVNLKNSLKSYLENASTSNVEVSKEADKNLTKVDFAGDALVYLIQLEHR